jgi:hypothetical protein
MCKEVTPEKEQWEKEWEDFIKTRDKPSQVRVERSAYFPHGKYCHFCAFLYGHADDCNGTTDVRVPKNHYTQPLTRNIVRDTLKLR